MLETPQNVNRNLACNYDIFAMITQIYEVQTPKEADALIRLGVDHIGSVLLAARDWKQPDIGHTIREVRRQGAVSSLIPLFSEPETVLRVLDYYQPDIIHLCELLPVNGQAREKIDLLIDLQMQIRAARPDIKIMRSIPIAPPGQAAAVPSLAIAAEFEPVSDYFLTDTLFVTADEARDEDQPVSGFVGITGKTCDWQVAADLVKQSRIPVILAGGIDPDNVGQGIAAVRPSGVDSCTGTNAVDRSGKPVRFKKDLTKVRRLVEQAKQAGPCDEGRAVACPQEAKKQRAKEI